MTPLSLLVVLFIVFGVGYCLWRPQAAFVAIIVMYPLEQLVQSYIPFAISYPYLVNVGVALVAGLALMSRIGRNEPVMAGFFNPAMKLSLALYALAWVGLFWSPGATGGRQMMIEGLPYYVLQLVVAPLLLDDVESFRRSLTPMLVAGTAVAVLILASPSTTFESGRLTVELEGFGIGERGNPLALAQMGAMMVVVAALYVPPSRVPVFSALRAAAFLVGLALAIGSGSRGQVFVSIATAVVLFPFAGRIADFKQFAVTVVTFAMVMGLAYLSFSLFISHENESRWTAEALNTGVNDRLDNIRNLMGAFFANPLAWPLGLGTNAFSGVMPGYNYVHNLLVEVLCEEGLLGITLLAALLWKTFAAGRSTWQVYRDDPVARSTVVVLGGLSLASFLLALKESSYIADPSIFMFWVFLGKVAMIEQMREPVAQDASDSIDDAIEHTPVEFGAQAG